MWTLKSEDDQVKVYIKVGLFGRETHNYRCDFKDKRPSTYGKYKKSKTWKRPSRLSSIAVLCGGFLSGMLLQAATDALKLR